MYCTVLYCTVLYCTVLYVLTCWIVLQVESIESMEGVVCVHVQSVDRQIIRYKKRKTQNRIEDEKRSEKRREVTEGEISV